MDVMFKVNNALDMVSGVFILILVYLLITHGKDTRDILSILSGSTIKGIQALQGKTVR